MRLALVALATLVLCVPAARAEESPCVEGRFTVEGRDPRGSYSGEATLSTTRDGIDVRVDLRFASGGTERRTGRGTSSATRLDVVYTRIETTPGLAHAIDRRADVAAPRRLEATYSLEGRPLACTLDGRLEERDGRCFGRETFTRRKKLALVLVNKRWEVKPLLAVLDDADARPPSIDARSIRRGEGGLAPRASFETAGVATEVWCVEDLIPEGQSSSSTRAKWEALPRAFAGEGGDLARPRKLDLVIAAGTGAVPDDGPALGSVIVGSRVFIHDPRASAARPSRDPWRRDLDRVLTASAPAELFRDLAQARGRVEEHLERPPVASGTPRFLASARRTAVGVVNVLDNDDYAWADPRAIRSFEKSSADATFGCVETTLGILRLRARDAGDPAFVFVGGALNRVGKFQEEVRGNGQTVAVARNLGLGVLHTAAAAARRLAEAP